MELDRKKILTKEDLLKAKEAFMNGSYKYPDVQITYVDRVERYRIETQRILRILRNNLAE